MIGRLRSFLAASFWPSARIVENDGRFAVEYITVEVHGDVYLVPKYALQRPACISFLRGSVYEPQTHELMGVLLTRLGGDMVHAGTFFGDMLPSFARKCRGRLYAFEPVLENYVLAKLCLQRNGIENVLLLNAGLGAELGITHMDTGSGGFEHRGGSSRVADQGQITSLMTIDTLNLQDLSVLQLDVEGYELHVLNGASETLDRCRPLVLVEDNNDECAGFLKGREYRLAGEIPGLKVWSTAEQFEWVAAEVERVREGPQSKV